MSEIKEYQLDNGKDHLFGLLVKETNKIDYIYEYSHQIPLAMGMYMEDLFKKDSKYTLVKFKITDVQTVKRKEAING